MSEEQKNLIYNYSQNRELSWLNFNKRVLDEAMDSNTPTFEKLKFISIFFSNLEEFYKVRVGSLTDLSILKEETIDNKTGLTSREQLQLIFAKTKELLPYCDIIYRYVMGELKRSGIEDLELHELDKYEKKVAVYYFENFVEPILSPQVIDSHHPFPFL